VQEKCALESVPCKTFLSWASWILRERHSHLNAQKAKTILFLNSVQMSKIIKRVFHNQSAINQRVIWEVIFSKKNVNITLILFPTIVELWTI
jgi:hypothetical protein